MICPQCHRQVYVCPNCSKDFTNESDPLISLKKHVKMCNSGLWQEGYDQGYDDGYAVGYEEAEESEKYTKERSD